MKNEEEIRENVAKRLRDGIKKVKGTIKTMRKKDFPGRDALIEICKEEIKDIEKQLKEWGKNSKKGDKK